MRILYKTDSFMLHPLSLSPSRPLTPSPSRPLSLSPSRPLALIIGNSRLHWGYFDQRQLLETWHTPHLKQAVTELPSPIRKPAWVYIVSVVPEQTQLWESYSRKTIITQDKIPLH